MKLTGQLLKERREALKISIAEVSISTKITSRMLQAIESGDMDLLPARTFLRGFVKSYATYLKMDVEQVLKSFTEEMTVLDTPPAPPAETAAGTAATPTHHVSSSASATPSASSSPGPAPGEVFSEGIPVAKKVGFGVGIAALIALIFVVYGLVQKYEKEGQVEEPPATLTKIEPDPQAEPEETADEKPPVDDATEAPAPAPEVKPVVEAKPTEVKPEPAPAPAPAVVEPKPEVKVETKVEPKPAPAPEVKPAPEPKPVAEVKPPEAKPVEPAPKPVEAPKPAPVAGGTQEIIIEALDKVDVTFKVNDGQSRKVSLLPDQVHTIKAAGIVAIEMSDGGAVNIIHNGRDIGVPGDLGRPKKIQLP